DTLEQFVGTVFGSGYASGGMVYRQLNNMWVVLGVNSATGYVQNGVQFFHTSTDCSGPRYMNGEWIPQTAQTTDGVTAWVASPITPNTPVIGIASAEYFGPGQAVTASASGDCVDYADWFQTIYQMAATTPVSIALPSISPPLSVRPDGRRG